MHFDGNIGINADAEDRDRVKLLAAITKLIVDHRDWQIEYEFEYNQPDDDADVEVLVDIDIYGRNITATEVDTALTQLELDIIWQGNIVQENGEVVYTRQCALKEGDKLDHALEHFLLHNRDLAIAAQRTGQHTMCIEVMHGEGLTQPVLDHIYTQLGRAGFTLDKVTHHRDPDMGLSTLTAIDVS